MKDKQTVGDYFQAIPDSPLRDLFILSDQLRHLVPMMSDWVKQNARRTWEFRNGVSNVAETEPVATALPWDEAEQTERFWFLIESEFSQRVRHGQDSARSVVELAAFMLAVIRSQAFAIAAEQAQANAHEDNSSGATMH